MSLNSVDPTTGKVSVLIDGRITQANYFPSVSPTGRFVIFRENESEFSEHYPIISHLTVLDTKMGTFRIVDGSANAANDIEWANDAMRHDQLRHCADVRRPSSWAGKSSFSRVYEGLPDRAVGAVSLQAASTTKAGKTAS